MEPDRRKGWGRPAVQAAAAGRPGGGPAGAWGDSSARRNCESRREHRQGAILDVAPQTSPGIVRGGVGESSRGTLHGWFGSLIALENPGEKTHGNCATT